VLDRNEETCWQYNQDYTSDGYKTYIVLTLSRAAKVQTLLVKNGFWKINSGIDQYWRNNRVKAAVISFQYEGDAGFTDAVTYTFADVKQIAEVDLGGREDVVAVRFAIESVYRGERFDEVAITYMELVGYPSGY